MTRSYRPPPVAEADQSHDVPVAARAPRKGHAREERDLFEERDPESGFSPAAPKTGERSENSVLFSLDTLKRQAESVRPPEVRPSGVPSAAAENDATGTIDLRAISASTGGSLEYKPLELSEPIMSQFVEPEKPAAAALKTGHKVAIGGGIAAAVLSAVGLVFALKGDAPVAMRAADITRAPGFEPSANRLRGKIEEAQPSPIAHGGRGGAPIAHGSTGGHAAATPSAGSAKPPPPKPSVDKCGCHGVLACIIRCAATGK
jgi:hypothetical protein